MNTTTLHRALACAGLLVLVATARAAGGTEISFTGQPTSWVVQASPYRVTGFDGARLGMTVDEVSQLVAQRHPASVGAAKDEVAPVTQLRTLTITVPELAPGPGAATINYVFGATSRRLVAVNVSWLAPAPSTPAQRAALVVAAQSFAGSVRGYRWPPLAAVRGQVPERGLLIVFSGKDEQGGGLEIRLDGVDMDMQPRDGATALEHRVAPPGPARLRLAFVADTDQPDVARIPAGAF